MGIIQLNGNHIRKLFPGALRFLEAADDIIQGGGNPEVLLLEPELLSPLEVVVGVEHGADGLGPLLVGDGALIVPTIELLEVELTAGRFAGPEPEVVGGRGGVSGNGHIIGHGSDSFPSLPVGDRLTILVRRLVDLAVELDLRPQVSRRPIATSSLPGGICQDSSSLTSSILTTGTYIDRHIVAWELPGIEVEPVVRDLDLITVDDLLLENAITVPQTVAPCRVIKGGETVEEASSKTAQTTVSESGIILLLDDVLNAETKITETRCNAIVRS